MKAIDYKMGAYYNYDASGERNLKLTGGTMDVTQNGYTMNVPVLDQQTLYASSLVTVNDKGYTKHYFEEGKRICSRIGGGELQKVNDLVEPIEKSYEEQRDKQYQAVKDGNSECLGGGWFDIEIKNLYKSVVQPYESKINSGEPIFYYHSDHLGSASFLTDRDGYETQQLVYLPFGELRSNREYLNINNKYHEQHWVDMKYNTGQYDTPYKFNGKEKDEETGYNNFGARYYYDWASIWLSVDPMSDKYPHLTSYNYCANNPVMLIDPNGKEMDGYYNLKGNKIFDDNNGSDNKKLVITKENKITSLVGHQYIDVPSNGTVDKMEGMYDKKNEKGMLVGENGKTSQVVTGTNTEISDYAWHPAKQDVPMENVAYNIHSHPEDSDDGGYGQAIPSDKDKKTFFGKTNIAVVLGYKESFIKDYNGKNKLNKTIGFYNKNGLIGGDPESFRDFKDVIHKINKQ